MADSSKYINGFFATEKEGQYGPYISIGITDEGIEALKNLPKSGDFRNFTLSKQKNDPSKFSAVKAKGGSSSGNSNTDDLPW